MRSYFKRADPFFDEQENHSLIGVANVFLACLFYDVKLQYAVPIINQKGEVGHCFPVCVFFKVLVSRQTLLKWVTVTKASERYVCFSGGGPASCGGMARDGKLGGSRLTRK